jgi:putative lipoic acid-binding regulatory protein
MTQTIDPKWAKLQELLAQEAFPLPYVMKLIGKNTVEFQTSLKSLESRFPKIKRTLERSGSGQNHWAVTIEFVADHPEEVILIYQEASGVSDLLVLF